MSNVPHRLMDLSTWSAVDGAVWGGCEIFSGWSLAGGQPSKVYSLTYFQSTHSGSGL